MNSSVTPPFNSPMRAFRDLRLAETLFSQFPRVSAGDEVDTRVMLPGTRRCDKCPPKLCCKVASKSSYRKTSLCYICGVCLLNTVNMSLVLHQPFRAVFQLIVDIVTPQLFEIWIELFSD